MVVRSGLNIELNDPEKQYQRENVYDADDNIEQNEDAKSFLFFWIKNSPCIFKDGRQLLLLQRLNLWYLAFASNLIKYGERRAAANTAW